MFPSYRARIPLISRSGRPDGGPRRGSRSRRTDPASGRTRPPPRTGGRPRA